MSLSNVMSDVSSSKSQDEKAFSQDVNALEKIHVNDSAPTGYEPSESEKVLDKRINLKFDLIVMPVLVLSWMFSGLDKSNVGNALTVGFIADTGFNPDTVNNAVSMTAVFTVVCPLWLYLAYRVGPRHWMAASTLLCSICTVASAFCKTTGQFYFVRMLQAASEAAWLQLACYIVSTLYTRYDYGSRVGLLVGLSILASAFGGLIAYGAFKITDSHLHGWQILFVLEGCVSILLSFLLWVVVPNTVGTTWYLSPEERAHAEDRMARDSALYSTESVDNRRVTWRAIKQAVSWHKMLIIASNIMMVMPVVAFNIFTPVLVMTFGYTGVNANLMSVTPFVAGCVGIIIVTKSSDHFKERSLHVCVSMLFSIVGLAVILGAKNNILRYVFLHICMAGSYAPGPLIFSWFADNTPDSSSRSILFGLNGLSGVAVVIAGQIFKPKYAPTFKVPLTITIGMLAPSMCIYAAVRAFYMWENAKRRKLIANMTPEEIEAERLNQNRLGDNKITFIRGY